MLVILGVLSVSPFLGCGGDRFDPNASAEEPEAVPTASFGEGGGGGSGGSSSGEPAGTDAIERFSPPDSVSVVADRGFIPGLDGLRGGSEDPETGGEGEEGDEPIPLESSFLRGVISFEKGENGGFGEEDLPGIVLGPPQGGGESQGSLDVLSLGEGGEIIVDFGDRVLVDGEGDDLIVFENPFFVGGDPEEVFIEVGIVSVSQDGELWCPFPFDIVDPELSVTDPERYEGFAGVTPVYSSIGEDGTVEPDPFDPEVSGGDPFDLADIGLLWGRYLRITDPGFLVTEDRDGDLIDDAGDSLVGPSTAGFDLDAVAAIYTLPLEAFAGTEISECPEVDGDRGSD